MVLGEVGEEDAEEDEDAEDEVDVVGVGEGETAVAGGWVEHGMLI